MKDYDQETGRETGTVSPDITGIIIAIHKRGCSVEAQDSFYWKTDSLVWNIPDPVLNAMAADALARYSKAFGGKEKFLTRLAVDGQSSDNLAPALRKQVQRLRNQRQSHSSRE